MILGSFLMYNISDQVLSSLFFPFIVSYNVTWQMQLQRVPAVGVGNPSWSMSELAKLDLEAPLSEASDVGTSWWDDVSNRNSKR
jgi:hypothetical protein